MFDTIQFDMAESVARIAGMDNKRHCVTTMFPNDPQVTLAYVPFQLDKTAYTPEKALEEGTLFTTLNKPFCGRSVYNG